MPAPCTADFEKMPGNILGLPVTDEIVHENRWLTGFLCDETLQRPIAQAIISIGSLGIAFTDASGWFKIFIPADNTDQTETLSVSLNTPTGHYQECLNQSIHISKHNVHIQAHKALTYHLFTKTTSIKTHEACTFIQTSA